jgi:hypothetical protein
MAEVLSQALDARAAQISVCVPGKVVGYNRTRRVANVEPVVLREGEQRPATVDSPVVFPGPIYWDVQIGSYGLLVVADEDWRQWHRQGIAANPEAEASHELASAFFLPQVLSEPDQKPLTIGDSMVIDAPTATGIVSIGGPNVGGVNRNVLHSDLVGVLNDFLLALTTWGTTVHASHNAQKLAWDAGPAPFAAALIAAGVAGDYAAARVLVRP